MQLDMIAVRNELYHLLLGNELYHFCDSLKYDANCFTSQDDIERAENYKRELLADSYNYNSSPEKNAFYQRMLEEKIKHQSSVDRFKRSHNLNMEKIFSVEPKVSNALDEVLAFFLLLAFLMFCESIISK